MPLFPLWIIIPINSYFVPNSDLLQSKGEQLVGGLVNILIPYINIYEYIKFGKYASNTSMDGFEKSDAGVMVVHSEDDNVVQKKYGYDIYYEKYKYSSRFEFISYSDKGHNQLYYSESAISYINEFNEKFKNNFGRYGSYDSVPKEQRSEYIKENLDRKKWSNLLDEDLFNKILNFYNSNL